MTTPPKYEPLEGVLQELVNRFTYHKPHGDQAERYEAIRAIGGSFASALVMTCPHSRELSLALTKLDEVVF